MNTYLIYMKMLTMKIIPLYLIMKVGTRDLILAPSTLLKCVNNKYKQESMRFDKTTLEI
jgi:hypothetical protein